MTTYANGMTQSTRARKLGKAAKTAFSTLVTLAARGREDAALELHKVAASATTALTRLCQNRPELFTAIAAKKMSWPVMWGAHRDSVKENEELIDQLKLASAIGINFSSSGKRFAWTKPQNKMAVCVYQIAQALRRAPIHQWDISELIQLRLIGRSFDLGSSETALKGAQKQLRDLEEWGQQGRGRMLPALSRATADEWAKAIPDLFRLLFGENFEVHSKLRQLRKHVEFRTTYGEGKKGGAGNLRQEMLRAVKQAFRAIAMD